MKDGFCLLSVERRWSVSNRSLLTFIIITLKEFMCFWQQYEITKCAAVVTLSDTASYTKCFIS